LIAVAVFIAASSVSVSAQSEGVEINKRPLRDFGNELKRDVDSKKIDLSGPFLVELRGKLDDKGKFDVKSSSFERTEGDPALVENVKRGILAMSDAGYFQYLRSLDSNDLTLFVEQTASDLQARIAADFPTTTRAQTVRSALHLALELSRLKKQETTATENDRKDLFLLSAIRIETEGKSVIILFKAPAAEIHKMVAEKLSEQNGQ
jgi:hypothetical protein